MIIKFLAVAKHIVCKTGNFLIVNITKPLTPSLIRLRLGLRIGSQNNIYSLKQ